jgi:hypothetical protein
VSKGVKVTLVLDDNDVGQIVDGLTERMADWRYTAQCMEGGPIADDRNFLECSDSNEANRIADHYERIIGDVTSQWSRQKRPSLKFVSLRRDGPKEE